VNCAKSRKKDPNTYYEKHHIIPKSLGGNNLKTNLVYLTAREHFICHLLLPKFCTGENRTKMLYAKWRMCNNPKKDYIVTSRTYQKSKEEFVTILSTIGNGGQFKKGKPSWNKGIPRTEEVKQAISKANSGKKRPDRTSDSFTEDWKLKISQSKKGCETWNKGITHSDKTKELMSAKARQRPKKICQHCHKKVSPSNFFRWHGDNCKLK